MSLNSITISNVDVNKIVHLRLNVLGWKTPSIDLDSHWSSRHFAAALPEGDIIGCASVGLSQLPLKNIVTPSSMIRFWGVAVDELHQGIGIGKLLLNSVLSHGRSLQATHAWANARESALPFYQANKFNQVGEPFTDPLSGLTDSRVLIALS